MSPRAYSYIRFSTPEQLKGDSLRRQLAASKKYADEHNLELDGELNLQDHGLSAFSGAHRTRGALGIFINLIEKGKIPKGSILIIEAFDRLSREKVLDAFNLFSEIIKAGISVVTLNTGQEYTEENINSNFGLLLMSLYEMSSAWGESDRKSKRLKEAWKEKRNNIDKKKLTARAPAWLKLSEDKTKFIAIQERVKVINQIFAMKKNLFGIGKIETTLNEMKGIWKPKNGWRRSYIQKILRNDAVIGHYQPHKKVDGKRIPTGEIMQDYYPPIIEETLFYEIQEQIKKNKPFGGRNGTINNLFGGLAKCQYCGAPIRVENKGTPPKGNKYLVCDTAKRGIGCHKFRIRYNPVEDLILTFCEGLNVADILEDNDTISSELETLESTKNALEHEIEILKTDMNNLLDRLQKTTLDNVALQIEQRINDIDESINEKGSNIENLGKRIEKLKSMNGNLEADIKSTKELIEKMKMMEGENLISIRKKLRAKLRNLIHKIDVAPVGVPLLTEDMILNLVEELHKHQGWTFDQIEKHIPTWRKRIDNIDYQTIKIHFKTGKVRILQPTNAAPLIKEWASTGIPFFFEL